MRKNYSVYVHKVETENGPMYYAGVSKNLKVRWYTVSYKETSLFPYIEQYGWENIEHAVVFETTDSKKAREIEDQLIRFYSSIGRGINTRRSGLIEVSDPNRYMRNYYANNPEYAEHQRQYNAERCANDPEYAERKRKYWRDKRSTPEGKIYSRVRDFNRYHPDRAIETPKDAREKYRKTGYIPPYIKREDIL